MGYRFLNVEAIVIVKLQTSQRFVSSTSSYCRSSFLKLSQWMFELSLHCRDQEPVLLLLGNKADLATADGRQVAGAEAAEFARRHRMIFLETSALITQEVEYAFEVDMNISG